MTELSVQAKGMGVTTETKGLLNSSVLEKDSVPEENLMVKILYKYYIHSQFKLNNLYII